MARLSERQFVDIVMGPGFCEFKVATPELEQLVDAQRDYPECADSLRSLCLEGQRAGAEFLVHFDGLRFRVTTMQGESGPIWLLSRIAAQVRALDQLPLPKEFIEFVMRPRLQGLVLFTGGFGTGKTTTASSLFKHRIETLGGLGISVEDPAGEVKMLGRHGPGRIIQIPVSKDQGGYHAALQLVRRSRASLTLVGEIRDAATAIEAQDISNTDMPVFATMHANSIVGTFDKYQSYLRSAAASSCEANSRLALSISAVVHLSKEYVRDAVGGVVARYTPRTLIVDRTDTASQGAVGKILNGNFVALNDDIEAQASRRFRR